MVSDCLVEGWDKDLGSKGKTIDGASCRRGENLNKNLIYFSQKKSKGPKTMLIINMYNGLKKKIIKHAISTCT